MILYQLLRPVAYLQIEHPKKFFFDWVIPVGATLMTAVILLSLRGAIVIWGSGGVVERLTGFVQTLPGFYIAALAAIATFNRQDIDRHIPAPTPEIEVVIGGKRNTIKLTRRRFLCMLFAFLTAESIVVSILGIGFISVASGVRAAVPEVAHVYVSICAASLVIFLFWQLIVATALGLYYLGDRLQQPEP